ncbi:uncharacterized protein LOC129613283 [Condylostylus longicornis]|uniref:uncharacterized protein LOC129613283 n=1 Tax=Condylostylus longicornis TaxID=2530218 RepID=UPI00244DFA40|nr:uncharacterized protein LOC129613283 [Condylostylus longicornis]
MISVSRRFVTYLRSKTYDKKLRNILELDKREKQKFLDSFDMVLSDCDGVLWHVNDQIKNSGLALNLLKDAGKTCHLVSNNCLRSENEYYDKLTQINVKNISEIEVVTPIKSVINYLKKIDMRKPIYTIADKYFNELYENVQQFVNDLPVKDEVGAVIFDIDLNLNVAKLDRANKYLQEPNCLFMVGACDYVIPLKEDLNVIGPEIFINLLRKLSNKRPYVLGKPGVLLAEYLFERFNIIDPKRVLFIGDNLVQDIGFALNNDFQALLVLSGASNKADVQQLPEVKQPHYFANSIVDFVEFFNGVLALNNDKDNLIS